ncbi:hypothetical protein N7449_000364 [Penicillium cf. viridicatum]|uniref:DNA2/NAM7 helicase-like C-terminal domain-containing protein n=1 Tax=Penicillium cf. viridicatum TaxID=2972119 RepID=A0A9W9N4W3_9EURO|nr:hypothetical protein N7449_000364 [Penicillium cf. viridicatum]
MDALANIMTRSQDKQILGRRPSTAGESGESSLLWRFFTLNELPAYLVVEEASQMAETHSLNAIMRNLNSLRKVILSGDMAQLPPMVISKGNECFNAETVSLFERMIKTGHPYTELNVQYRMTGDICKHKTTLNQVFRGNGETLRLCFWNIVLCLGGEIVSLAPQAGNLPSKSRIVNFITTLVEKLVVAGCAPRDILVLSFYDEERRTLSSLLHGEMGLKDVEVKSVDAAQGSESPCMVLSTTRPGGSIGLVQNRPRQCVALSRAQYGLVVVGDEFMGKRSGEGYTSWDNLIQNHIAVGRLIRRHGHRDMMRLLGIPNQDWVEVTRN